MKYRSGKQSADRDFFLSRYPLSFHEASKSYNNFIDLSSTTKTINAIKTVYTNNISSFIPFNKLLLQNFQTKSAGSPKIELKTVINDQKVDSIIGSVYEAAVNKIHPLKSNLNSFSRKSKILLRYWKQLKLNNKVILKLLPKTNNLFYPQITTILFIQKYLKNVTCGAQKSF